MCGEATVQPEFAMCVLEHCSVKESLSTPVHYPHRQHLTLSAIKNETETYCGKPLRDRSHDFVKISEIMGILSVVVVFERFVFKQYSRMTLATDD